MWDPVKEVREIHFFLHILLAWIDHAAQLFVVTVAVRLLPLNVCARRRELLRGELPYGKVVSTSEDWDGANNIGQLNFVQTPPPPPECGNLS